MLRTYPTVVLSVDPCPRACHPELRSDTRLLVTIIPYSTDVMKSPALDCELLLIELNWLLFWLISSLILIVEEFIIEYL